MEVLRRTAARALILAPDHRALLMHMDLPWLGPVWMLPGGGSEAGESLVETVTREVFEETGLRGVQVGPELWSRDVRIDFRDRRVESREHCFLAPSERFEPSRDRLLEEERAWLLGYRWWSAAEIAASDERFAPQELARLLDRLVREGPPSRADWLGTWSHATEQALP